MFPWGGKGVPISTIRKQNLWYCVTLALAPVWVIGSPLKSQCETGWGLELAQSLGGEEVMGMGLKEWKGRDCKVQPHYFAQDSMAFISFGCLLINE